MGEGERLMARGARHYGDIRAQALDWLAQVEIDPGRIDDLPRTFSGGMLQRAMIAMAIACEPAVLIADEPTTALDVTIQAQILDLLKDLQRRNGMAVVLITHDLGVVAEMADDVAVMYAGKVVEASDVDTIFGAPHHPYTRGLLASIPRMGERRERLEVIPTPGYLRASMPFAAYFQPGPFDAVRQGTYVVTPSVDGDPRAMREHNRASISNTSIHEAYPGHHLQLAVASKHPSLTRMLTEAPEFVEGWGMYSEQMMREEGFDTAPAYRLAMHTDAIWRACRIVLDIRLQRGELGVEEGTELLREMTRFEPAVARAEVLRYTYTPTYQLSYLVGKVMLLRLREDERHRLGPRFRLRD